ncbi:MAG: putative dehydrogenase [Candidatus Latescibacterota bacterium]|jgi:predicted dehydrogenase
MSQRIKIALLGAGGRGTGFAKTVKDLSHLAEIVAVAEPRESYREDIRQLFDLPENRVFTDWRDLVAVENICDAVIIATMDQEHVGPALACQKLGYHMMLEKPMATSLEDCQKIAAAQKEHEVITTVCHSLRYNKGFALVKDLIDSGKLGEIITIDQLEQVGFWHQAHSFVRGNWGNEANSTFMLLAKSCHDIDYISYLAGRDCRQVSSFGSLSHFTAANAPEGSSERCTGGCAVEATCPYSAIKAYVDSPNLDQWPANVCAHEHTREAHRRAIETGPYGRCVYRCDNDVVDHQVVAMHFDAGVTATFTMTAFTQGGGRKLRVHGSVGELLFDESEIAIKYYGSNNIERIAVGAEVGGHGGGDKRVVSAWLDAIRLGDPSLVTTDVHESLRTHSIVFAAEQSRRERRMIDMAEIYAAPVST